MGKKGGNQKKGSRSFSKTTRVEEIEPEDLEDEIDAFHKQRDIIPLDVNDDTDETDEDGEHPVFDIEDDGQDEDDDEEDKDIDDEDAEDDKLAAKIIKQKKYLRAKFGNFDDEMADDDKDEEDKRITWGGRKGQYHGGDNADFEIQSSDDEALEEEEAEVLRLQREAAESLTAADVGLEDDDSEEESDRELTLGEISLKGKHAMKSVKGKEAKDHMDTTIEEVKKDINSLSKEEQMDVVYSSAPELVGLLSELNDAVEQLENKINPVMSKLREGEIALVGQTRYLEVKQLLLLAYCQAITFYLLLKSEGQPVRDHPVIARLVEIKGLLDKIKELDGNLPPEFEEILKSNIATGTVEKMVKENAPTASGSLANGHDVPSPGSTVAIRDIQDAAKSAKADMLNEENKEKGRKRKRQNAQAELQSKEMLRLRAALEEKLKNNGIFASTSTKPDKSQKRLKSTNGKLETFDDYVDDADNTKAGAHGITSNMLSQLVSAKRKPKIVSGDDDLPKRDDIGERRRKFELKVLAGAGVKSEDDGGDEPRTLSSDDGDDDDAGMFGNYDQSDSSEDDFYEQVKHQREAKLAAKAEMYSRPTAATVPSLPETVDGKRQISYQMEKNKGLTRKRNKDLKNPRKKYRKKHDEKVKRRKGQVREIRKPSGPYGGETTGINAAISRSVRFKN